MINNIVRILKATIKNMIVAFLIIFIVHLIYKIGFEKKFKAVASLINVFAQSEIKTLEPRLEGEDLVNRPTFGSKYATLKIPSINVELPIFCGENLSILKMGIGQDSASYFPGEGGTVLLMGHNFKTFLSKLPEVKNNDVIEIETNYGKFSYKVYDKKIVGENEVDKAPIQRKEEILIIYTCWPINNIGHADKRYLVYAKAE